MRILQFINHISLDVAIGAVISSLFFAKIFDVQVGAPTLLLLGLVVWLIYTYDHLQDAKAIDKQAMTVRHRFHQDNFKKLTIFLITGLLVAAVLVFFLPKTTLVWGASLFCFVGIYFLCIHFLNTKVRHYKEIIIAVLYAAGILLPVLSVYEGAYSIHKQLVIAEFILLAFTNLLIFSILEADSDRSQKFSSLVLRIGNKNAAKLLSVLIPVHLLLLIAISITGNTNFVPVVFAAMVILLYWVIVFPQHTKTNLLYRIIGDAVFILPAVVL